MEEHEVKVYTYDVTRGLARSMSAFILGKQIDGVWHTGVVVYGHEFTFGGAGIMSNPPCGTILGRPDTIHDMGKTQIPQQLFMEYLQELSTTTFRPECYHLFNWNCNTFSNEVVNFLTGHSVPDYIINLPREVLDSPSGASLMQMISSMTGMEPDIQGTTLFPSNQSQAASSSKATATTGASTKSAGSCAAAATTAVVASSTTSAVGSSTSIPAAKTAVPNKDDDDVKELQALIIAAYEDKKVVDDYKELREIMNSSLASPADTQVLNEITEYLMIDPGVPADWGLAPPHIRLLVDVILDKQRAGYSVRHIAARLLQATLLREDVIAMCVQHPDQSLARLLSAYERLSGEAEDEKEREKQERVEIGLLNCAGAYWSNYRPIAATHWLSSAEVHTAMSFHRSRGVCNCLRNPISRAWILDLTSNNSTNSLLTQLLAYYILRASHNVRAASARAITTFLHYSQISEDQSLTIGISLIEVVTREDNGQLTEACVLYGLCCCIQINKQVRDIAVTTGLDLASVRTTHPLAKKYLEKLQRLFSLP